MKIQSDQKALCEQLVERLSMEKSVPGWALELMAPDRQTQYDSIFKSKNVNIIVHNKDEYLASIRAINYGSSGSALEAGRQRSVKAIEYCCDSTLIELQIIGCAGFVKSVFSGSTLDLLSIENLPASFVRTPVFLQILKVWRWIAGYAICAALLCFFFFKTPALVVSMFIVAVFVYVAMLVVFGASFVFEGGVAALLLLGLAGVVFRWIIS